MPSAASGRTPPFRALCAAAEARSLRVALTIDGQPERTRLDTLEIWEGRPVKGILIARTPVSGKTLDEAADTLLDEMRAA